MEVERSIWLRKKTNELQVQDELVVHLSFFLAIYIYTYMAKKKDK